MSRGRGVKNEPSKMMLPAARLFPAHNTRFTAAAELQNALYRIMSFGCSHKQNII